MPIQFKMLEDGAFVAGDTETRITCYAYPTSTHAVDAASYPVGAAEEMLRNETSLRGKMLHRDYATRYDARNWEKIGAPEPAETPGQFAYEEDCRLRPYYDGNKFRPTWEGLAGCYCPQTVKVIRDSWERDASKTHHREADETTGPDGIFPSYI